MTSLHDYVQFWSLPTARLDDLQEVPQTHPEAQAILAVRLHLVGEW
jgi:hypothetical protein